MSSIQHSVDVNVPIHVAYNQWTQFESFPEFMEGVQSVKQLDDTHLAWTVEIGGVHREFETEITEQHPDERIAWRSLDEPRQSGVVTFHRIDDNRTRVTLQMEYEPKGFVETAADLLQIVRMRVRGDLERFKQFVETRGRETGAWRGDVPGPHQRGDDTTGGSGTRDSTDTGSAPGYGVGEPMPPQPVNPDYPPDTPLPPPGSGPIPPAGPPNWGDEPPGRIG
jgi:ribosome-associated toxin RatA of RatAB toxin-antitoxin module